jgi:hypothetical protein
MTVRVTRGEFEGLMTLCAEWHITRQDLLSAIIIDALEEEGIDALRRKQQKGCSCSGEAIKARGATTP